MKVLVSGGGTAGHVTPVLAVTAELQRLQPGVEIIFVAQKNDPSQAIVRERAPELAIKEIRAGKLRRFYGVGLVKHLSNLPLVGRNLRDCWYVLIGICQAWRLIGRQKPDVVFIKGGYVGLPVGIAAHLRKVPIVCHDSDVVPGLTNRILSRWARFNAVTMPEENYGYASEKMRRTGLPIDRSFEQLASAPKQSLRRELGLPVTVPMILVMPGSSGAKSINDALLTVVDDLITKEKCCVVHITGTRNYDEVIATYQQQGIVSDNLIVRPFLDNPAEFARAADIVVTRAGSMLIELAALSATVISVPNPYLTGGHQSRNAEMYQKAKAIVELDDIKLEAQPQILARAISKLLHNTSERQRLSKALHQFYTKDAAAAIAKLLIEAVQS